MTVRTITQFALPAASATRQLAMASTRLHGAGQNDKNADFLPINRYTSETVEQRHKSHIITIEY